MNDVMLYCKECRAAIGVAIGDEFHSKGWRVLRDAMAHPFPLKMLATTPEHVRQAPCAGRARHWFTLRDIYSAVQRARRSGKRMIDVDPTPCPCPPGAYRWDPKRPRPDS